jgi:hypothetical protein
MLLPDFLTKFFQYLTINSYSNFEMTKTNNQTESGEKPAHEAYRILRGGASIFMEYGGKRELIKGEIFSPASVPEYDVTSYFSGKLRVYHAGNGVTRQTVGAPLPAAPTKEKTPTLNYAPHSQISWTQEDIIGLKLTHTDKRKPEKSILGETANKAIARGGVAEKVLSPWAHTMPDHLNFLDRLDPRKRVPGYVGANQAHTVFESAAKIYAQKHGSIKVTREMGEPIAGESVLPSALKLGFVLDGKDGSHHHFVHEQPYFTNAGGRNGDEKAIVKFLEIQKQRIDDGLSSLADKVIHKTGKRRVEHIDKYESRYESVAANYLAAKLGKLSINAEEGDARTASPSGVDQLDGNSPERKRKRDGDDASDDRSSDRDRSRSSSRSR